MSSNADTVPRISVIIPTCHRNDLLSICLEHLEPGRQTLETSSYEVIVTDDGSTNTAEELVRDRFGWAKWVPGPRRGPAANRNRGAQAARAEWLVFCDDDCLPDPGLLMAYLHANVPCANARVLEGRIYAEGPKSRADETAPLNEGGGLLWSCNFCIKRDLFFSTGGFDERFPFASMEDVEFREKLKSLGEPSCFVALASVCHPWRRFGGWKMVRQSIISHKIFWERNSAFRDPTIFLRAGASQLKSYVRELIRYRGRGLAGGMLRVLLSFALALTAARSAGQHKSHHES